MASLCSQADTDGENNGERDVLMQYTMSEVHDYQGYIRAAPPNGLDCLNIDKFHRYLAYRSENTVPDAPPYTILARTRFAVLGSISISHATSRATFPVDTISSFLDDARVPHLEADINFRCTHGDGNEWEAVISYRHFIVARIYGCALSEESPCCPTRTCVAIGYIEMPAGPARNFVLVVSEKALSKVVGMAALVAPSAALEPLMGPRSAAVETHVPCFISRAALPDRAREPRLVGPAGERRGTLCDANRRL
ncbi:hypothetical protein DFH06DRAFT_1128408 [Mycena polygramma]|nr:hypothetical protein DFH06DRAFT_1128408 [Mycena polygramma]